MDGGRLAHYRIISRRARRQRERFGDLTGIIVTVLIAGMLLLFLLLSVSSLIVPGGLLTRMLGHAVVTGHGREIGRMLSLGRVLVGMILTLAALGIGEIVTIVRPERGPHDGLLGTRVVPR